MDIIRTIRKLAKTNYYQSLYSSAKEINLKLFRTECDYTKYQIMFLQYLNFYNNLNSDVYMKDVDKIVLDNEVYEDAYSYYKSKKEDIKKDKPKELSRKELNQSHKISRNTSKGFRWSINKGK